LLCIIPYSGPKIKRPRGASISQLVSRRLLPPTVIDLSLEAVSVPSEKNNLLADRLASSQGSTPKKLGVTALDCAGAPEVVFDEMATAANPTTQAIPVDAGAPTIVGVGTSLATPSPYRRPSKPQQGAT